MKKVLVGKKAKLAGAIAILGMGLLASPAFSLSLVAPIFWKVQDGKLLDSNGNPFVFRGVTINHTLAPKKTVQALKDIAAKGANSAQIEFSIQGSFPRPIVSELREIIQTCKDNKLVCVLEPNDGSGYSETVNSVSPSIMAYYWGWSDLREVLNGAQGHVILGLSNQILGNIYSDFDYIVRMETYLSEFRANLPYGFMIMIDGNKWGQDSDKAMLQLAARNLQRGGDYANVIYSVDMFDAYRTPESVRNYITSFSEIKAPLVIGGFAPAPYYHPYNTSPRPTVVYDLPEELVMQYAEQYGAGYFGWSWSGNENSALDLAVNYDPANLTNWGKLLFDGANGIKATAKPASIFSSSSTGSSSSSSSSSAANQIPQAVIEGNAVQIRCGLVNAQLSGANSFDPDGDSLTYDWQVYNPNSLGVSQFSGPTLNYTMRPVINYQFTLTVSDGKGGVSSATKTLSHAYSDNCIVSSASSSTIRSSSSSIRPSSSSVPSVVSSSSVRPSSVSSSSRSSSSAPAVNNCSYVIQSQWNNGFTAVIRIKNNRTQSINGWNVNWQYADGSKITNLWNASLTGGNPYNAKNLSWNSTIQPGQTVEFGFQGSKAAGNASVPVVTGSVCQ